MSPLLEFESDVALREKWFIHESFAHPAKLHLGLYRWIYRTYTQPGETIGDPMAGIGTALLAATEGRNVIAYEVEKRWLEVTHTNAAHIIRQMGWFASDAGTMTVGQHDARQPWTWQADHLIFSPPYACSFSPNPSARKMILDRKLHKLGAAKYNERWRKLAATPSAGATGAFTFSYGTDPNQIGHWRGKRYWEAMAQIYDRARSALRDGVMVLVIKDHIVDRKRVCVADETVALCESLGFVLVERHKRLISALSLWQRRRKEKGEPVIEEEDVLVFRRT